MVDRYCALLGGFAIGARVSMTTLRRTRNVSECLYSLCAWFHLSLLLTVLRLSSSHTDVAVVVADADDDSVSLSGNILLADCMFANSK